MRKTMIAGNWKMNCPPFAAKQLVDGILSGLSATEVEIVVAPPFVSLPVVAGVLAGSQVKLAAQNVAAEEKGAFTGEVSAPMLAEVGVEYVIVGHSERRQLFAETDELVNKKVLRLLDHNLGVILCIGETLEQRDRGLALTVCRQQLQAGLAAVPEAKLASVVIAYEPIWAIGTGRSASGDDAQQIHRGCRECLAELYSLPLARSTRILYGGSVKPDNVSELMAMADIDGALVGGASLTAESFVKLINY